MSFLSNDNDLSGRSFIYYYVFFISLLLSVCDIEVYAIANNSLRLLIPWSSSKPIKCKWWLLLYRRHFIKCQFGNEYCRRSQASFLFLLVLLRIEVSQRCTTPCNTVLQTTNRIEKVLKNIEKLNSHMTITYLENCWACLLLTKLWTVSSFKAQLKVSASLSH